MPRSLAALSVSLVIASSAFAQCVQPPSGLVAWWQGDRNANDFTGAHNGVLAGDAGYDSTKVGIGFTFYSGVAEFPDGPDLHFGTGDFTIEYWVRFLNLDDQDTGILSKDTYAGDIDNIQGIVINICNNCGDGGFGSGTAGLGFETREHIAGTGPDTHCRMPANSVIPGVWYHMACVRHQQVLTLYLDSVPQASVTELVPTNVSTSAPVTLGGLTPAARQLFSGQLDEVTIYNRALSQSEIASIVQAGSAGKCTHCPADFNNDSAVDFFDYLDFVDAFASLDPGADFNNDFAIDFFDYLDFVDAFSVGC